MLCHLRKFHNKYGHKNETPHHKWNKVSYNIFIRKERERERERERKRRNENIKYKIELKGRD